MRNIRNSLWFMVGVLIAVPLIGGWAYWKPGAQHPGDRALLAQAEKLSGRSCKHDQKASEEDGERGLYCNPPVIVERDLSRMEAYGMYDPFVNPRVIYVDPKAAKPGSAQWRSTVLHEYVHYLQWLDGDLTPKQNPCKRAEMEIEAHTADLKAYPINVEQSKEIIASYQFVILLATSEGACN